MGRQKAEGRFDATGTSVRVEFPGQYDAKAPEEAGGAEGHTDIEHGSGPMGLRRIGKKFVHLKSRLRKRYGTTKKAA